MAEKSKYEELGVDPDKRSVREIFGKIVKNDFPGAFVNIVRGTGATGKVFTMHADGDGSKMVQRLLHYLEIGDEQIFQGAVDDAFSMNSGDVAASGFVFGRWIINQIININAKNAPKDLIMRQIALRVEGLLKLYESCGFKQIFFLGGETADLPDQVNSVVYDVGVFAEGYDCELVTGNVQPGDQIYGFASDGQASWESFPNSGIMANGLTLARTCLMQEYYGLKYPFLVRNNGKYQARFAPADKPDALGGITVSQALLSPTRQWAILIRLLIQELKNRKIFHMLHGISLNTGGGATKIAHVGQGILYVKTMPDPPPIFHLIQAESGESWRDMYKDFNCGVGIDVVGSYSAEFKAALKFASMATGVKLFHLGKCVKNLAEKNSVILRTQFGDFMYY
ncbi:hypothetical protein HY797_01730 [Candidatus Falkowbacteria bacterium]|nr:hypothetical protein [Candidatus Falkowbacteria bacterium]